MKIKLVLASMALCFSSLSYGAQSTCNGDFLNNTLPQGINYNQEICYNQFAVLYDYKLKIPMISAEHLTKSEIDGAKSIKRKDAFHAEPQIPVLYRQLPTEYHNTGFDKGHMTPAGDMANTANQFQSFSMANMTPQTKKLNEITWKGIETTVRNGVEKNGEGYILTGALVGSKINTIGKGTTIPDTIYKAVYYPTLKSGTVYVAPNNTSETFKQMSYQEFKTTYGITLFN